MTMNHALYKPALAAAFAAAGDRFFLNEADMRRSAMFGIAVGTGVLLADVIGSKALPASELKTLETRVLEVGMASVGALALDRYVANPGVYRVDTASRVGVIIASEILGDYTKRIVLNEM